MSTCRFGPFELPTHEPSLLSSCFPANPKSSIFTGYQYPQRTMKPDATSNPDPTAISRKKDHIDLAFKSQVESGALDRRFNYEPALAAHPEPGSIPPLRFLGKTLHTPIWVSSMTGGTGHARTINRNLARACAEFGMGMGLGSCRQLLYPDGYHRASGVTDEAI